MGKVLFFILVHLGSAHAMITVKDLRPDWMIHRADRFEPALNSSLAGVHTIYFTIGQNAFNGQYLSVKGSEDWSLFVDGKLIFSGRQGVFSMDSLRSLYTKQLFLAIHNSRGIGDLSTTVIFKDGTVAEQTEASVRPPVFFRDYAIVASGMILLFLLLLVRTNPQLTLDYLSFTKIFSVQERNETLLASRITSSVNLLFYLFCALLTGFLLSTIFYEAGHLFSVSRAVVIGSLSAAFAVWMKLSLFILLLLAAKLVFVLIFSSLFNFSETVSFQFFNFLRFVLFTAVVMGLLSFIYFLFGGAQPGFYKSLIVLALLLLSIGSVMVLVKLLARASFSFFHLFSYLCASEIIPLVIIIKIFF